MRLGDPSGRHLIKRVALDCFSESARKVHGTTTGLLRTSECESTRERHRHRRDRFSLF